MFYQLQYALQKIREILNSLNEIRAKIGAIISGSVTVGSATNYNTISSGAPANPADTSKVWVNFNRSNGQLQVWDPSNSTWN